MSGGTPAPERVEQGRTTIAARALRRVSETLVASAGHVPAGSVSVHLEDDRGALRADVVLPLDREHGARTLAERGEDVREAVIGGMDRLAGRRLSRVDVRFTAPKEKERRTVR
ncbi:hypothetical protein [uncultured Microbacterium sp.]|uniref:hypothetical protein n=1 Tax=uncultured Microbacterium sp. TaxID=191216 RepID=UPI0025F461A4|nr:hypothetical protein [uncultured Microbacterium sp.]